MGFVSIASITIRLRFGIAPEVVLAHQHFRRPAPLWRSIAG
jgi:hypothetical protein